MSGIHHVELWVRDLTGAREAWGWMFDQLGWSVDQTWPDGSSWRSGQSYVVLTRPPRLQDEPHDRRRPGMNHLALWADSRTAPDTLVADSSAHGWTQLYPDRYPHAGGPEHYAAYLESSEGFKLELVAR